MQPTSQWLPSEQSWLSSLVERVLIGDVLLVRALPRWGITAVCDSLLDELGASAVYVDGRTLNEDSQKEWREGMKGRLTAALDEHNCAQLVFDNYGHAMRRSQKNALHSMLFSTLIDNVSARDTGALLVAKPGDPLEMNLQGSPLLSRAERVPLPELTEEDAIFLSQRLDDLRSDTGASTWLARRFLGASKQHAELKIVEHLNADSSSIVSALPARSVEVLAGAAEYSAVDPESQAALGCLGDDHEAAGFKIARLVEQSRIVDLVTQANHAWPEARDASVGEFLRLVADADDVIWIDRFALGELPALRAFLVSLRGLCNARIRILASQLRDRPALSNEVPQQLGNIDRLEIRFMHRSDRLRLHDRQLVDPAVGSGFVIPTAGVIVGKHVPGSAVAAAMPALPIDYEECWRRAVKVLG